MNGMTHWCFQVKEVEVAPDTAPCPVCGTVSCRHSKGQRTVIDIDLDCVVFVHCTVGVYRCSNEHCSSEHRYFRLELPFAPKGASYTYRAVDKCIASLREDKMPFSLVPERVLRDFHIHPAVSSVHRWYHQQARQLDLFYDYYPWVTSSFSGVLCIDELYDKDLCLIMATDPLNKKTVAFTIEEQITEAEMERFLVYLKTLGIAPQVIVTDGSRHYPKTIAAVFPDAQHQLCLFHVLENITKDVLQGVLAYRRSLTKPHSKKGRPRKEEADSSSKCNQGI